MSNVAELHRSMLDAVHERNWSRLESLLHSEYTYTAGDGAEQAGTAAALAVAQTYTEAFPDLRFEILHQNATANVSVVEFRATGTHRGELEGIAPTGRSVDLPVCNVIEERDGKIIREREYYDSGALMQQLGVLGDTDIEAHRTTVAAIYEAFGRGDVEFILDQLADDVAWDVEVPHWGLPWYEARRGREGVREFFATVDEHLRFDAFEVLAMLTSDDQTAAIIRFDLVVKATGKRVADTEIHLWKFGSDGKVVSLAHIVDQHGQILAFEPPAGG